MMGIQGKFVYHCHNFIPMIIMTSSPILNKPAFIIYHQITSVNVTIAAIYHRHANSMAAHYNHAQACSATVDQATCPSSRHKIQDSSVAISVLSKQYTRNNL